MEILENKYNIEDDGFKKSVKIDDYLIQETKYNVTKTTFYRFSQKKQDYVELRCYVGSMSEAEIKEIIQEMEMQRLHIGPWWETKEKLSKLKW